jgi:hypothetical protein
MESRRSITWILNLRMSVTSKADLGACAADPDGLVRRIMAAVEADGDSPMEVS